MTVPVPNREHAERLAKAVVCNMDLDDLIEFAEDTLTEAYLQGDMETWYEDWETYIGEEND